MISRIILCRAMPLSTTELGLSRDMASYMSLSINQKAMVLSPTKACRPEMHQAKLEMQSSMHSFNTCQTMALSPTKACRPELCVCLIHVQSLRCSHPCIHSTHIRRQWPCHPPKPASQSCVGLLHVQSLRCNQACTRSTHVFFQAQVHAVLSSSLYEVLFFSHLVAILCIAHTQQDSFANKSIKKAYYVTICFFTLEKYRKIVNSFVTGKSL